MVKSFFSQSVNRAKSSLTETVEVQPEEREEIREADARIEREQQTVHPTPQPTAPQPTRREQQPTPVPTPAAAPAPTPAVSPAQPVDTLFADTTQPVATQPTEQENAPQAATTATTSAPVTTNQPASTEVEAHEAVETTVMPAILNYKPEQSRGNIELKNGAILRKVTFRMTPDNIVLVKTVAAQRNIPVQAVLNALVEEGLKQGRCDLHTAEQFLQYHKA